MKDRIKVERARIGRTQRQFLLRIAEKTFEALHRRAALNRRSLNLEITRIIDKELQQGPYADSM